MEQTQAKSTLALHKEGNKSRNSDLNMTIHKASLGGNEGFYQLREVTSRDFFLLAIILNVYIITTYMYDKKHQPK